MIGQNWLENLEFAAWDGYNSIVLKILSLKVKEYHHANSRPRRTRSIYRYYFAVSNEHYLMAWKFNGAMLVIYTYICIKQSTTTNRLYLTDVSRVHSKTLVGNVVETI